MQVVEGGVEQEQLPEPDEMVVGVEEVATLRGEYLTLHLSDQPKQ